MLAGEKKAKKVFVRDEGNLKLDDFIALLFIFLQFSDITGCLSRCEKQTYRASLQHTIEEPPEFKNKSQLFVDVYVPR